MRLVAGLLCAGASLLSFAASAATPRAISDWPCQQPLVPTVTAAMIWQGPSLEGIGDWQSEPSVAALVQRIAPRRVATEDGIAAIDAFVKNLSGDRKQRLIALAFAGLLGETNRQRSDVTGRIKELAERQRNLANLVSRLTTELDAMPADSAGDAAAAREELVQRLTFTTRTYNEVQQTMRYVCEVPGAIDSRLGAYARALQAGLS